MAVYKLTVEYNGASFSGYQIQNKLRVRTVQGEIEKVLAKILEEDIQTICAGRTDTGVHSLGQTISFQTERGIPPEGLQRALNSLLDNSVSITDAQIVSNDFHARFSALRRKYIYVLDNSPHRSALLDNRVFWYPRPLDVERMKTAVSYFEGTHDYKLFVKSLKDIKTTIRSIERAEIYTSDDYNFSGPLEGVAEIFKVRKNLIFFYFQARSFLHSQVRLMTGNLIEVGRGALEPGDIKKMLDGIDVRSTATNIPGGGLYFLGVDYPPEKA